MSGSAAFSGRHYTLERDNRELQPGLPGKDGKSDYTLERDNRELQQELKEYDERYNYTLERDNRELQLRPLHL